MVVNNELFERSFTKWNNLCLDDDCNEVREARTSLDKCELFQHSSKCLAILVYAEGPQSIEEHIRAAMTAGFVVGVEYARLSQELAETEGR